MLDLKEFVLNKYINLIGRGLDTRGWLAGIGNKKLRQKEMPINKDLHCVRPIPIATLTKRFLTSWWEGSGKWQNKNNNKKKKTPNRLHSLYIITSYITISECGIIRFSKHVINFILVKSCSKESVQEEELEIHWGNGNIYFVRVVVMQVYTSVKINQGAHLNFVYLM